MNNLNPITFLLLLLAYFALLLLISYFTGKKSKTQSFYTGDRQSPWFVVAFGMVGATISGVTFISVPGETGNSAFHYFQFVMGNMVGYIIIATLLLPFYYRKNIVSIYTVLEEKTGKNGYLTTSGFFILSKIIGASFRLYLAALVIDMAIFGPLGIPFWATVLFCLLLIWLYTFRSGIKTVVWTDTLQTLILLGAAIVTVIALLRYFETPAGEFIGKILAKPEARIFEFGWKSPNNFFKQFFSGIVLTIALNGFDQDIIQKNLTCRNSSDARKNMLWFSGWFGLSVFLFLLLGAMLYAFAQTKGIELPEKTDRLFPLVALNYLGKPVAILFILGISAAAFSSADSATTAMTTAFSVDFMKIEKLPAVKQTRLRNLVHFSFTMIIFGTIILFYYLNNESVVVSIFKAAGYTYGPIAGVFCFAFFIKRKPISNAIVPICIASPVLTYLITALFKHLVPGYGFGFELIIINTLITVLLLLVFSKKVHTESLLSGKNKR
ncbi:MAG: sodium:solute symporter [Prolixibacteraceae bacterium]|nr:sodium:solute symporter [Prolixibacteraceae bacterium]